MSSKLHTLDLELHPRAHITQDDNCYYFMEKESEGYSKSSANNLINNFKKPVERRGRDEWKYKENAIKTFIEDLCNIHYTQPYTIIPAPTSKPRAHPDCDNRIDEVVQGLKSCHPNLNIEFALDTANVLIPAHLGGSREIDYIKSETIWNGISTLPVDTVILVDDVLTMGSHFKAWKEIIMEKDPRVKNVIGVFWALHVWA